MYPEINTQPAQPARKPSRKPIVVALAAIVGALALCCGIGSVATLVTKNTADTTRVVVTRSATPAATQAAAAPATTAAKPSLALTTPPAQLTPAQQLRAWYDAGGSDHLHAVANALGQVASTTGSGDIQGAQRAALGLGVAVKSAQQYAPLPDPTAQRFWAAALDSYAASAQDLYVGIETMDTDKIQRATNEMADGEVEMRHCTDRIHELAGV